MLGNYACTEGAIAAGCRFFAGYPITPASEIAERMARRLPEIGGRYIQMEDELASMAAILGASCAGTKSMTATSGPGFSLMVENIGLGMMTETPCVVVNIQRGGPSTGLPTLTSQGDMMQARWGSHGDYEAVVYVPSSVQEMFDLTIKAFNTSERFRLPVFVHADQLIGHMTGHVRIPNPEDIEIYNRKLPDKEPSSHFLPFLADGEGVPPMVVAGEGYNVHVTGLTHDDKGYPAINVEAQRKLMDRLIAKIHSHTEELIEIEEYHVQDAEVLCVTYGSTACSAREAVRRARQEGLKAGLLRLVTVWPFPEKLIAEISANRRYILVPEGNYGQIVHPVREFAQCPVECIPHPGGDLHQPEDIYQAIRKRL
jgi:2-oxoglutarate ferredoxin oxidoreductase subunit alpha